MWSSSHRSDTICLSSAIATGPYLVTGAQAGWLCYNFKHRKLPRFHADLTVLLWHTLHCLSLCLSLSPSLFLSVCFPLCLSLSHPATSFSSLLWSQPRLTSWSLLWSPCLHFFSASQLLHTFSAPHVDIDQRAPTMQSSRAKAFHLKPGGGGPVFHTYQQCASLAQTTGLSLRLIYWAKQKTVLI